MTGIDENSSGARVRGRVLALLAVLSVWICVFWPILDGSRTVGFRDSVYMHYPVLKWTTGEIMAGRLPLWSPNDGAGMPVVGEGSTAIFYPFKAILLLPGCSFVFRYNLFLSLHVLLASLTGAWCARRLGCSRIASVFAGLSSGFSGPVLFQVTNQIYLVGAAWLPVAFGCVRDLFRSRLSTRERARSIAACSAAMAMMVLGGDPQMAAMIVIVFAGTIFAACVLAGYGRWRKKGTACLESLAPIRILVLSLVSVCLLSFLLAAVQVLPSAEFARFSERAGWQQPQNVFGLAAAYAWADESAVPVSVSQLVNDPIPGTHHDFIYQFSQPPWSLAELLLPGVSGSLWPENTRWLDGLPGADRMWNVSLYQGLLVFLLAVVGVFLRRSRLDGWLIGTGLFFCLAAFGWYGLGWLVRELGSAGGFPNAFGWLGRPTGGVYWFLVTFVPVVSGFRYPAKMFVIATLCVALLAGRNLDLLKFRLNRQVLGGCLLATTVLCMVGLVAGVSGWLPRWVEGLSGGGGSVDSVFGPTNLAESGRQIGQSMLYVICAGMISATCIVIAARWRTSYLPTAFLLLLMLDLAVCQRCLVPTVDSAVFDFDSAPVSWSSQEPDRYSGYRTVSLDVSSGLNESSVSGTRKNPDNDRRLDQVARWQVEHGVPRFNLISQIVRQDFFVSLQPDPNRLPCLPVVGSPGLVETGSRGIRIWEMNEGGRLFADSGPEASQWGLIPRVYAIPQNMVSDPGKKIDGNTLLVADERGTLVIPEVIDPVRNKSDSENQFLKVVEETSGRIEAEYEFGEPMVIVLPEGWCGGWTATVTAGSDRSLPLTVSFGRPGGMVQIAKGTGKLSFAYRPASLQAGATLSLIGWLALIGINLALTIRHRRST